MSFTSNATDQRPEVLRITGFTTTAFEVTFLDPLPVLKRGQRVEFPNARSVRYAEE